MLTPTTGPASGRIAIKKAHVLVELTELKEFKWNLGGFLLQTTRRVGIRSDTYGLLSTARLPSMRRSALGWPFSEGPASVAAAIDLAAPARSSAAIH